MTSEGPGAGGCQAVREVVGDDLGVLASIRDELLLRGDLARHMAQRARRSLNPVGWVVHQSNRLRRDQVLQVEIPVQVTLIVRSDPHGRQERFGVLGRSRTSLVVPAGGSDQSGVELDRGLLPRGERLVLLLGHLGRVQQGAGATEVVLLSKRWD